jgi:hypothetical protein
MSELVATSAYGSDIGLIGAMVLAQQAHETKDVEPDPDVEKASISPFNMGLIHGVVAGIAAAYIGILLTRRTK